MPLSAPSETWLERVQAALCDERVSHSAFSELKDAFRQYLTTLDADEATELERRMGDFDLGVTEEG